MTFNARKMWILMIVLLGLLMSACVTEKTPNFRLATDTTSIELSKGSQTEIQLRVEAFEGFSDEVQLELVSLPEGLTGTFESNPVSTQTTLILSASGLAQVGKTELEVKGVALKATPPLNKSLKLTLSVIAEPNKEVVVPETTVVIAEAAQAGLMTVAKTSLRFAAGSPTIERIKVGDVIVGERSALAPEGFLRRVLEVSTVGNQVVFTTEQASLLDAITKGSLREHIELKPEDVISTTSHLPSFSTQAFQDGFSKSFNNLVIFDKDDNETTTNDQVRASGLFEIKPVLDVAIDIDAKTTLGIPTDVYLDTFEFHLGLKQHAKLEITAEFEDSLDKEIKLFSHKFKPYYFTLGGVPIYIQPSLTVSLGIDGEIKAVATFTAEQDAELIAGFTYTDEAGFKNDSSRDFGFSNTDVDFKGELKTETYLSAKLNVTVDFLAKAFGEAKAGLKIDGKIPRDPTWILEGCFELKAGFELDLLIKELKFEKSLLELCREIGRADNSPPEVEIINPKEGSFLDLGLETNLDARGLDPEDGTTIFCCDYKWESNREGVIASGPGGRFAFRELGEHEIKVTITDSKGASSTAKVNVTVVNSAPRVEINKPLATTIIFRGTPAILQASSFDKNEPESKLACERLVWISSLDRDALPKSGCELELVFTTSGTRTLTLTGIDPQGATAQAKVTVTVIDPPANLPPTVHIRSPSVINNVFEPLTLNGTATDPEGDTPLSFQWTAKLNTAAPIVIGTSTSLTWTPSESFDFSDSGTYTLELRFIATDSKGNSASDFVLVEFRIIN